MSSPEEVSLTAGECQKRIDQFIEVTKTDEVAPILIEDFESLLLLDNHSFLPKNYN